MTCAVCSTTCANLNRLGRHRMLRQRGRSKNCSHIALAAVHRRLSRFCTCRGEWCGRGSGPFHPGVDSDESVRARNAIHTKGLNLTLRCLRHPKVSGEGRAHACTRPSLQWKRGRHLRRRRGRRAFAVGGHFEDVDRAAAIDAVAGATRHARQLSREAGGGARPADPRPALH